MMKEEYLKEVGIDTDAGLARFLNDKEFYHSVLEAFSNCDIIQRADKAYEASDMETFKKVIHEAKGTCGNIGFDDLFVEVSSLMNMLRSTSCTQDQIKSAYDRFKENYRIVDEALKRALK